MGKRKASNSPHQDKTKRKTKRLRRERPQNQTETGESMSVTQLVQKVQQTFAKNANQKNAVMMKKYMRNQFEFFGLKSPIRRSVSKEFLGVRFSVGEMRELLKELWLLPERDMQLFGIDYLDKHINRFGDPLDELESNFECLEYLIVNKSWWDTVDMIASHSVGYMVRTHPDKGKPLMEKWIKEDNMWLRRTALLHQLSYKGQTDEKMLYSFCIATAHEKEFFIQKAMGWALRQYANTKPSSVKTFLHENKTVLSKLTYREAAKHLGV